MDTLLMPSSLIIGGSAALLIVVGLTTAVIMPGVEQWSRRFFILFYSTLVLLCVISCVDALVYGNPDFVQLESVALYFEYLIISILIPMLTAYLLHCCGEDWRQSSLFRFAAIQWCFLLVVLGFAQFTDAVYYLTPENLYFRGPWHFLLMVPMDMTLVLDLLALLRRRSQLSLKYFIAFLIYLVPMTVAMIIHTFVYVVDFVTFCLSICTFAMFSVMLTDQVEQYTRQQREIARQQADIMVLQMRPHFIYNTMTSIYYLCEQDPKKAQQVTLDFTTYLRKNFTAIASEHTILFPEELEHTRAYLAVEQAQFEDQLFVDYDTPHLRFRLPPLTLQPIVENAIKHGMDPDSDPLHITIRTRKRDFASEIVVEDDGSGFDPVDDSEPHIALNNIKQRLGLMCHGGLAIADREGGGTVVTVTISD